MLDLQPATDRLATLISAVRDDQLAAPTPCPQATLGDLVEHVDGLALAFAAAARKNPLEPVAGASFADAARLGPDWRVRLPQRLAALTNAWRDPQAWTGMTAAGGVDLPGELAGVIALNEVIVHGWDIAVASGQPYRCDDELLQAAHEFVAASAAENPQGTPSLFGPPVPIDDSASLLDRLIALSGRQPAWRPSLVTS